MRLLIASGFDGPKQDAANALFAHMTAVLALALITSSQEMAKLYGKEIDSVKDSNVLAAVAVAHSLVHYAEACNVPFESADGGYRRYLSAYLVLRNALKTFGLLAPWEKYCEGTQVTMNGNVASQRVECGLAGVSQLRRAAATGDARQSAKHPGLQPDGIVLRVVAEDDWSELHVERDGRIRVHRDHTRLAEGQSEAQLVSSVGARRTVDAVALNRSLQNIVGSLGAGGPALLFPAWPPPPALPATAPPRCFHVMPFSKDWSDAARDEVAEACRRQGWTYVRGDDSQVQRIVPAIWREICLASAVIIDITGHNPNVALELGLVHALGRPYRVVAQDRDPRRHAFSSLAKVQLHAYRMEAASQGAWPWIVRQGLAAVGAPGEAAAPKTLAEIVGPFLASMQQSRPQG